MSDEQIIAHTVAELIVELQKLDPVATVFAHEPPFTGVTVILQSDSGNVYIASLYDTPEGQAWRKSARPSARLPEAS